MLTNYGTAFLNSPTDYQSGYYALPGAASGPATTHGWFGYRTPISGTMSYDTNTGAGVATINSFMFFGNTSNQYASVLGFSFQSIDTAGTLVGGLLLSWNQATHQISIVMDGSGLLNALPAAPVTDIVAEGALPATDGLDFDISPFGTLFLPLGPSPVATKTTNTAAACDGLTLATQVNAYTINTNFANLATCTSVANGFGVDDDVGGDPATSFAFSSGEIMNFDFTSVHINSVSAVPIPRRAVAVRFRTARAHWAGTAQQYSSNRIAMSAATATRHDG